MSVNAVQLSFDIVPPHLAVKAMRDNGYKNAAYALAELMDNAVQAGASQVELLCADKTEFRNQRRTTRIHQIAVLDNGSGMSEGVLRIALQFGNGSYLDESKHTGIGRFGMGLPSSSISQCRRVDVWSWQNGIHSALCTHLDLDEIASEKMREVPAPLPKRLPSIWQNVGTNFGVSGTLVVWSDIDRCLWRRSESLIRNSELLIGRIYRRILDKKQASIRLVSFDIDAPEEKIIDEKAKPNDPLYLMHNTSCPGDPSWIQDGEPMFIVWGEPSQFDVEFRGSKHRVLVNYSVAKNEARQGYNPGTRKHGKHAAKNLGVSIVRADRELDLDPGWTDPSNPTDRWWGVEIDFPPALDDFFGVTNNKQSARYFSDLAKVNVDDMVDQDASISSAEEEYESTSDPQWALFEIAMTIQKQIRTIRRLVRHQTTQEKNKRRIDVENSPEAIATEVTLERQKEGYQGRSDKQQEEMSEEERAEDLAEGFLDLHVVNSRKEADELAARTIDRNLKYEFKIANLSSAPGFFDVQSRGGEMIIALNSAHPAYEHLIEVLDAELNGSSDEDLRFRLRRASDGLRLLLIAWARYEDEQPVW